MLPFTPLTGCSPITETIVPDSDVSSDSEWTESAATKWQSNDVEGGAGDSDWVEHDDATTSSECPSEDAPNDYRVGLANPVGSPAAGICQGMRLDYRISDETDQPVGGCVTVRATLLQGTTVIVLDETSDQGSTPGTFTQILSVANVSAITDHNDLRVEVRAEVGLEDGMAKAGPKVRCFYVGVDYFPR